MGVETLGTEGPLGPTGLVAGPVATPVVGLRANPVQGLGQGQGLELAVVQGAALGATAQKVDHLPTSLGSIRWGS